MANAAGDSVAGGEGGSSGGRDGPGSGQPQRARHCCIGITRFNAAMHKLDAQPACQGVIVTVLDKRQGKPATAPSPRHETPPFDFVCYGYAEWRQGTGNEHTMPRCRLGYSPSAGLEPETLERPPAEQSQEYWQRRLEAVQRDWEWVGRATSKAATKINNHDWEKGVLKLQRSFAKTAAKMETAVAGGAASVAAAVRKAGGSG